jgi:hypothetical protein
VKITVAPMTQAFAVRSTNEVSHPSSFQRSHPPGFLDGPVQERLLGTVQVMSLHDAPETNPAGSSSGRSLITKILNCIEGLLWRLRLAQSLNWCRRTFRHPILKGTLKATLRVYGQVGSEPGSNNHSAR